MGYAQIYCTVDELVADLRLNGDDGTLLSRIRQACAHLTQELGNFIPITEQRTFLAPDDELQCELDPIIAITAITMDGTALTASDYRLAPYDKMWGDGPYLWIVQLDDDSNETEWDEEKLVITGRWSKYERTAATGLTLASQTDSATTLVVTDGSKVSVGMVLKVEDEQELVTGFSAWTDSTADCNEIDESQEEFAVTDATKFSVGETLKIGFEQMKVLDINGYTVLATRGWNNTRKASHTSGSAVNVMRTFTVERGVNGTTAAAHTSKAISQMVAPDDVNWLARQVAGLMRMKASAGFASKTGNSELGEAFYYNEFPRQIETVRRNYWTR